MNELNMPDLVTTTCKIRTGHYHVIDTQICGRIYFLDRFINLILLFVLFMVSLIIRQNLIKLFLG